MKTKWLLIGVALLTAVLAIGAIACSDDDDEEDTNGDTNGDVIDDDIDIGGDLGIFQLTASLTGPEASGEADISPNGEGILVSIIMEGLTEGEHANHLHDGSCDEQGEVVIALDNIVADENGDGSQTTANDEGSIDHYATGHYLAVHAEDGEVISCGDVVNPLA